MAVTPKPVPVPHGLLEANSDSILSDFDCHCLALLSSRGEDEGWQAELWQYLKDLPADVTKDTDIVKWWQVCDSMPCSTNQIITVYRTTGALTPPFDISPSITFLAKHHLSLVSVFSPLVVKSQ